MGKIQIGQRFARLVVLYEDEDASNLYKGRRYRVRCDCGTEFTTMQSRLLNGTCRSCGCLRAEMNKVKKHSAHIVIEHNGERHSIPEWSKITGIKENTIRSRYFRNYRNTDEIFSTTNRWTGEQLEMTHEKKPLRKFGEIEMQEINSEGEVIRTFANPYELRNTLKNPYSYAASTIVSYSRKGWTIQGRRFRIVGICGDFENTSNNLPDVE